MTEKRKRDYTKERLAESPERRKKRAVRNNARREALRDGTVKKGDNKVVNHKKPLSKGGSNAKSNREIQSRKDSDREGGKLQPRAAKRRGGRN
jgi:5-methylcytosine-specific restriction endonuclease McrA